MTESQGPSVEELEAAVRRFRSGPADEAVVALTAIANRAVIELHNVARDEAGKRRGAANWGQWARLANAARSAVLQMAAVRDTLKMLPSVPESGPEGEASEA